MRTERNIRVANGLACFRDHKVYQLSDKRLFVQGVSLYSFHVEQRERRLFVYGEYCPGSTGAISMLGYTLPWFKQAANQPTVLFRAFGLRPVWNIALAQQQIAPYADEEALRDFCGSDSQKEMYFKALSLVGSMDKMEDLWPYGFGYGFDLNYAAPLEVMSLVLQKNRCPEKKP